jgi:hypothetical protein
MRSRIQTENHMKLLVPQAVPLCSLLVRLPSNSGSLVVRSEPATPAAVERFSIKRHAESRASHKSSSSAFCWLLQGGGTFAAKMFALLVQYNKLVSVLTGVPTLSNRPFVLIDIVRSRLGS